MRKNDPMRSPLKTVKKIEPEPDTKKNQQGGEERSSHGGRISAGKRKRSEEKVGGVIAASLQGRVTGGAGSQSCSFPRIALRRSVASAIGGFTLCGKASRVGSEGERELLF